ncbi:MAG TPA: deoxyhypusine synthase family protein, partial [Bryobacteraceae bacterium]
MPTKKELLQRPIQHLDLKQHNVVPLVDAMAHMAYSARDTYRAANIYDMMLRDTDCGVILCLAGSLISAGLQKIFVDLIRNNMVDAVVSTGANIVDQDFFEALGFNHYIAGDEYKYGAGDADLRELMIDRIYDTFIDEEELRICDETTEKIINSMAPGAYSSREYIREMGRYLVENGRTPQNGNSDSITLAAY